MGEYSFVKPPWLPNVVSLSLAPTPGLLIPVPRGDLNTKPGILGRPRRPRVLRAVRKRRIASRPDRAQPKIRFLAVNPCVSTLAVSPAGHRPPEPRHRSSNCRRIARQLG